MSLSSLHLDAFVAVARELSFSKAAERLRVSQSALSQRIMNLEQELELTLFIRDRAGLLLTEVGERLLRYCQMKVALEEDLFSELRATSKDELAGIIRLGAYSSIMRSVIMPALAPLIRKQPKIQCEFIIREVDQLPPLLDSAEVDFIVLDRHLNRPKVEEKILGQEIYVVIEGLNFRSPPDVYLDHSPKDPATEKFFQHQKGKTPSYRRSYMGDVYGISDGVMHGIGRAVMSKHLIRKEMPIRVVKGYRPLKLDVTLHYHSQPFYSRLHKAVLDQLAEECPKLLQE